MGLSSVAVVAKTPTMPLLVVNTAGFTAGSMATIGKSNAARSRSTATPGTVLHATTTAFAPCATRNRTTANAPFDVGRGPVAVRGVSRIGHVHRAFLGQLAPDLAQHRQAIRKPHRTTHADVNNGTEPMDVMVVELQKH